VQLSCGTEGRVGHHCRIRNELIAPWVWCQWVASVHDGSGISYLRKNDRVKLVSESWAGNNDIMKNGLAEGVDIGVGRQDREYKISIDGSGRV
jgi:hypothetical protein